MCSDERLQLVVHMHEDQLDNRHRGDREGENPTSGQRCEEWRRKHHRDEQEA
jgi:hypothetical protein